MEELYSFSAAILYFFGKFVHSLNLFDLSLKNTTIQIQIRVEVAEGNAWVVKMRRNDPTSILQLWQRLGVIKTKSAPSFSSEEPLV